MPNGVPIPVVRRWTKYLSHLRHLRKQDKQWVSSRELAQELSLTDSTVRQDLSHVDISGRAKRGYEVETLKRILAGALGLETSCKAVIVGAGNLGRALALHEDFPRRGFEICGIFDSDPKLFGTEVGHLVVQSVEDLNDVVRNQGVEIGILAVPASAVRAAAMELVSAGVRGLLNLASAHVALPKDVAIVDVRILESLQELSWAIRMQNADRSS